MKRDNIYTLGFLMLICACTNSVKGDIKIPEYNRVWEKIDFSDNETVQDTLLIEETFVNFISALYQSQDGEAQDSFMCLLKQASINPEAIKIISDIAKDYLYTTESPFLDETRYAEFLAAIMEMPELSGADRVRYENILSDISKNKVGTKFPNLILNTHGEEREICELIGGNPAIILLYDNECDDCLNTIEQMLRDQRLNEKLQDDALKVISVNLNGEKMDSSIQMKGWVWSVPIGEIDNDIVWRSLPSIYVVNREGTIVIKDSSYDIVNQAIFH